MRVFLSLVLLATVACQSSLVDGNGSGPSTPANLSYELEPSGDPNRPLGILLFWDDVTDANLASYRVYSRASTSGSFDPRGETTSNSFHDNGVPFLQYLVTAVDDNGVESGFSNVITVDERQQLVSPAWLSSISLNGAIHLEWDDTSYIAAPTRFKWYRIYSTDYDLDSRLCGTNWLLEGTTVAPEFLASAMTNGVPRCFGVSAVSREGYESLWSPLRQDTPRPDARNTLVFAYEQNQPQSGFRFCRPDPERQPHEHRLLGASRPDGLDALAGARVFGDANPAVQHVAGGGPDVDRLCVGHRVHAQHDSGGSGLCLCLPNRGGHDVTLRRVARDARWPGLPHL